MDKLEGSLCNNCDYSIRRIDLGPCRECGGMLSGDPITHGVKCSGNHIVHVGISFCGRRKCENYTMFCSYSIIINKASHKQILTLGKMTGLSCVRVFQNIGKREPIFIHLSLREVFVISEELDKIGTEYSVEPQVPYLPNLSVCFPDIV